MRFGGFVDTYYAWDFSRASFFRRTFAGGAAFTTQPARRNELDVNLAYMEATLLGPAVRGRLALQTGTSFDINYVAESQLARHIQEAVAEVRVGGRGSTPASSYHTSAWSWISRDNLTYTRSLTSDYSPYYQSGVKLSWQPRPGVSAQLNVVNGWQNIGENNDGKGIGLRVDYAPVPTVTLSYYNLFSEEDGTRLRILNVGGAKRHSGARPGCCKATSPHKLARIPSEKPRTGTAWCSSASGGSLRRSL